MEYEKCYVFEPEQLRPAKRRKVEPRGLHASWKIRREAYRKAWETQQNLIDERLNSINAATVSEISTFLRDCQTDRPEGRIPTGIISTGPDAASQVAIYGHLSRIPNLRDNRILVPLSANAATNLKSILKTIIQRATLRQDGFAGDDDDEEEEDEERTAIKRGTKLLNYDLQILADHVRERGLKAVVLAVHDTEAFDSSLLSELVEILSFWKDRIPWVFLFSIATSLDFLQQRLSKGALKCLQGQFFDVAPSEDAVEQVFNAITDSDPRLCIGPGLMAMALERQSDYIQSVNSLVDAVRYAYMSCYYANALSIFLDPMINLNAIPADHFQAIRNLGSFQQFCEQLLKEKQYTRLKDLLDEDEILFGMIRHQMQVGRDALTDMTGAINVLRELQTCLPQQQVGAKSKLYIQALSNKLNDSSLVRSLLLSIRKAPSSVVLEITKAVCALDINDENFQESCLKIQAELKQLISAADGNQPLRSEDDVKNSTLRTTVVAQKVELSKQKSALSKEDAAYTDLLRGFTDTLASYFHKKFIDPASLVFHEIFLYDLKSPHREVFTPRPRHAIERALAAPHDYLDCDCCAPKEGEGEGDEATLASSQPATAVLYQLYLESGSLINASDLWHAFRAVMGEGERSEEEYMALFQRALAEMKALGLVKGTRKRVDHVAKVVWRGL